MSGKERKFRERRTSRKSPEKVLGGARTLREAALKTKPFNAGGGISSSNGISQWPAGEFQ